MIRSTQRFPPRWQYICESCIRHSRGSFSIRGPLYLAATPRLGGRRRGPVPASGICNKHEDKVSTFKIHLRSNPWRHVAYQGYVSSAHQPWYVVDVRVQRFSHSCSRPVAEAPVARPNRHVAIREKTALQDSLRARAWTHIPVTYCLPCDVRCSLQKHHTCWGTIVLIPYVGRVGLPRFASCVHFSFSRCNPYVRLQETVGSSSQGQKASSRRVLRRLTSTDSIVS